MSSPSWLPPTFCLASDTVARSKCVSNKLIKQGSIIFTEESFANVLLTREKGKRCDACFCLHKQLKKCSGCGLYWYCDAQCEYMSVDDGNVDGLKRTFRPTAALGSSPQTNLSKSQLLRRLCALPSSLRTRTARCASAISHHRSTVVACGSVSHPILPNRAGPNVALTTRSDGFNNCTRTANKTSAPRQSRQRDLHALREQQLRRPLPPHRRRPQRLPAFQPAVQPLLRPQRGREV